MVGGRFRRAIILTGILLFSGSASFALLPDTELGDVLLRPLDTKYFPTYQRIYVGHTGIMGPWDGGNVNDPTTYEEYDLQFISSTTWAGVTQPFTFSHTRIQKRTFQDFISINSTTGQKYQNYGGGWVWTPGLVVSPAGAPMSPSIRATIFNNAKAFVTGDTDITYDFFPFTKNGFTDTFRCDGFVEYILESAGVGGGQGMWRNYLEGLILSPVTYVKAGGQLEHGQAPIMAITTTGGGTVNNGDAISSNTITITGTEEATGSGLMQITLNTDVRAESGLTASETFSSLADGAYTATVTDLAGNTVQAIGFIIGRDQFLVEGRV